MCPHRLLLLLTFIISSILQNWNSSRVDDEPEDDFGGAAGGIGGIGGIGDPAGGPVGKLIRPAPP